MIFSSLARLSKCYHWYKRRDGLSVLEIKSG